MRCQGLLFFIISNHFPARSDLCDNGAWSQSRRPRFQLGRISCHIPEDVLVNFSRIDSNSFPKD